MPGNLRRSAPVETAFRFNTKITMTMIPTKKSILLLALAASVVASRAQTATGANPVGTLGHSYTELSFGAQDIRHVSPNFYDLNLSGNVPVAPNFDVGGGYSYGWIRGNAHGHSNTLNAYTTAYLTTQGARPFVSAGLGYQWTHFAGTKNDEGFWGAAIGVEIPAGLFSLTPRIAYVDDFHRSGNSSQQTTYEVEGNYWMSRQTAVFASLGKTDVHGNAFDSWNYRAGVRVKF